MSHERGDRHGSSCRTAQAGADPCTRRLSGRLTTCLLRMLFRKLPAGMLGRLSSKSRQEPPVNSEIPDGEIKVSIHNYAEPTVRCEFMER